MYSGNKYLVYLTIDHPIVQQVEPRVTIAKYQVGCPIRRSLGIASILDFPKLIAEYHVLHRLLLPRHPPNALFALDLIQKKTDLTVQPQR